MAKELKVGDTFDFVRLPETRSTWTSIGKIYTTIELYDLGIIITYLTETHKITGIRKNEIQTNSI